MVDANGVLTVAVQALVRRIAALEAEVAALREQHQGEGQEVGPGRPQEGSALSDKRLEGQEHPGDTEGRGWRTPAAPEQDDDVVAGHVQYRPPTEDGVTGRSGFDKAPPAHDDGP